ncbi:LacI family transcriptional regulator [Lewinella marina]|uniref:LacI family transcriptional regulator n=1 Tax=Neolewinella marina TaxID=438751 RepID=A0A2G0CJB7_9BACT|nr:LacI family DNA-binding transcriptional regulator [Neolewinella marina]NJB84778.1 LacI family transcriptional regulator [Neolewinella marina]PHL00063.1 LacI family transcriptional regulator [Neolewinella marina]
MSNKRKKQVTIYDLATELNVAPSTVSRALKDHYSIGKATITAVKELARKRGYRTNILASSLRTRESNTIGVLVPWINRPFISSLIHGVEAAARESGYNVIISQSQDSYDHEVANAKTLFSSRIHALVVSLAMQTTDYEHLEEISSSGTPVIFVDRVPSTLDGHRVVIDNVRSARLATQHLIDQGCRRIALFKGASHQIIYHERECGYREALQANDLRVDDELILTSDHLTLEEGNRLARQLLQSPHPPDGIFSTNDNAAVGAIKCARELGVAVPEQLAIIGFNNDPVCEIIDPPLSSVTHPAVEMGRMALQQALRVANAKMPVTERRIELETQLVPRASSLRRR